MDIELARVVAVPVRSAKCWTVCARALEKYTDDAWHEEPVLADGAMVSGRPLDLAAR